jgi:hypothetical protein
MKGMNNETTGREWLSSSIMYSILIDRFSRGNGEDWLNDDPSQPHFCGGNLQGVIDKLDYLLDLGIDTILLSPFHPTTSYHGYHVLDFYGVDDRFGSKEILKELLERAHERGIRVIMDFVLSHVSHKHPFFVDATRNADSAYRDWFQFTEWPRQYHSFLNFNELPKFDLTNRKVRSYINEVAKYWIDFGFDGLRLDHVIGIPHDYLAELHEEVREHSPACVLVGEAVKGEIKREELPTLHIRHKLLLYILGQLKAPISVLLQRQYTTTTDGVFDFFFRNMTKRFLVSPAWYKPLWLLRLILACHDRLYPKDFVLIRLLDNADHDRFTFATKQRAETERLSIDLLLGGRGSAMFFYGNAEGIRQTESRKYRIYGDKPFGDLAIRKLVPWGQIGKERFDWYRQKIRGKKQHDSRPLNPDLQ